MCVNKEHYTCCCCSLTTATTVFGVLTGLGCIFFGLAQMWISFSLQLAMTLIYVMVCVKPHDVALRKMLYYLSMVGWIVSIVLLVVVSIVLMNSEVYKDKFCAYTDSLTDDHHYYNYSYCVEAIEQSLMIYMIVGTIVQILEAFCVLQVLYHGWKEQEHKAEKDSGYSTMQ